MRLAYWIGTVPERIVTRKDIHVEETRLRSIMHIVEDYAKHAPVYIYALLFVNTTGEERVEIRPHPTIPNISYVVSYRKTKAHMMRLSDYVNMADGRVLTAMFHSMTGQIPVHGIVCPDMPYGVTSTMATEYTDRHYRIPVFLRLTLGPDETPAAKEKSFYTMLNVAAVEYADRVYTPSPHLERLHFTTLRSSLSFALQKEHQKKFRWIPHGVRLPEDISVKGRPKIVGSFGRLQETTKKHRMVFDVYDKAYVLGYIDGVVATMASRQEDAPELDRSYVDVRLRGYDYVEECRNIRCAMYNYNGIAFPVTLVEAAAHGVVPIVRRDRLWSTMLLPKDYPFTYDNAEEALIHIRALMEDDTLYEKWGAWARDWACAHFDVRETKMDMYRDMREAHDKLRETEPHGPCDYAPLSEILNKCKYAQGIVQVLSTMGESFTWAELMDAIRKHKVDTTFKGRPLVSLHGIYRLVHLAGYTDTMADADVTFTKV